MAVEVLFEDFSKLIELQIAFADRFKCPEVFAVAFLRPERKELFSELEKVLKEVLRETDIISTVEGNIFLLLPATDKKGAEFISRAIYDFFKGEVVEVYVDFPEDGKNCKELIKNLEEKTKNKFGYLLEKYFKE
ncbi:hypothetical protein SAMN06265182_0162 [Persephonella hydrogeniphila]|uniref:GGDEF domain-containing protein, diguanylate cyclase (C-di-GMP synthetase) or its enzymatically inactive variants n=1 Tax=Persephonella hydrogeniphila TaxID=198703 RepID=A0A285MZI2_9AQUI|nr:hypothetical protein [Persephonella hydrogeniphila]SNZ02605.1 hypothetical protein SAMN06265182_0162 [Persephonella hydrogeniphila]